MRQTVLVARYASVRAGLRAMLDGAVGIAIAGESAGSGDLAPLLAGSPIDAVVYDQDEIDSVLVLQATAQAGSGLVLLALDLQDAPALSDLPFRGWALLPKDAEGSEIVGAIHAVSAGLVAFDPSALPVLRTRDVRRSPGSDQAEQLTARELEILQLMAEGLPNKQIATRLGVSPHTAKFHVASILSKLEASSRTEAVTTGLRRGLVLV